LCGRAAAGRPGSNDPVDAKKRIQEAKIAADLGSKRKQLKAKWLRAKVLGSSAAKLAALKKAEEIAGHNEQAALHHDEEGDLPHHVAFSVLFEDGEEDGKASPVS
jgi:hypothetical protein